MAVKNSIANAPTNNPAPLGKNIAQYLTFDKVSEQIKSVVGGKNAQTFVSAVVSAVNNNPGLQDCTNQSIFSAALLGESLKLSPSPQLGYYYMVPFNSNAGKVAQFQIG